MTTKKKSFYDNCIERVFPALVLTIFIIFIAMSKETLILGIIGLSILFWREALRIRDDFTFDNEGNPNINILTASNYIYIHEPFLYFELYILLNLITPMLVYMCCSVIEYNTFITYFQLLNFIGSVFLTVVVTDTAAYIGGQLLGKAFGKNYQIFPNTSPNKTKIGTLIGLISGVLFFIYYNNNIYQVSYNWHTYFFAVQIPLLAILGDYLGSKMKRRADKKDSGTLFGAHGGVIDRFGSHFMSAIVILQITVFYFLANGG